MGLGAVAALFIRSLRLVYLHGQRLSLWLRPVVAGAVVGVLALAVPQVMGIGYDTVDSALRGNVAMPVMAAMVVAKVLATTVAVGLGVPGGVIGPSLVIGAMGGGMFGAIIQHFELVPSASLGFHVMLGMGAMMAGSLQAPLAGMLAVVTATLASGYLHGRESVFQSLLRAMGVDYRDDRIARALRQIGVAAVMSRSFIQLPARPGLEKVARDLEARPRWILIQREDGPWLLLPAVDVVRAIQEEPQASELDLLAIPAARASAAAVDFQASLQEAREVMHRAGAEALYVTRTTVPGVSRVWGVLTREDIDSGYRY
jgi:CIC family chloride channel protein